MANSNGITIGQVLEALNDKADINAGNFTAQGQGNIGSLSAPSDKYEDLTLTAGAYTAPGNGFLYIEMSSATYIKVIVNGVLTYNNNRSNNGAMSVTFYIGKGQSYTITGTQTALAQHRFVYAQGE